MILELEKQLSKAQQRGNDQLVSDLYVDLAEEHRRAGFLNEAIEAYKSSLIFSEKCCTIENAAFAHRAIAEMSVDCGWSFFVTLSFLTIVNVMISCSGRSNPAVKKVEYY